MDGQTEMKRDYLMCSASQSHPEPITHNHQASLPQSRNLLGRCNQPISGKVRLEGVRVSPLKQVPETPLGDGDCIPSHDKKDQGKGQQLEKRLL